MENNQTNQNQTGAWPTGQPAAQPANMQTNPNLSYPNQTAPAVGVPVQPQQPAMPSYQPPVAYGAPTVQASSPATSSQASMQGINQTGVMPANMSANTGMQAPSQASPQASQPVDPIQPAGATAQSAAPVKKPLTPEDKRARIVLVAAIVIAVISLATVAICAYLFAAA